MCQAAVLFEGDTNAIGYKGAFEVCLGLRTPLLNIHSNPLYSSHPKLYPLMTEHGTSFTWEPRWREGVCVKGDQLPPGVAPGARRSANSLTVPMTSPLTPTTKAANGAEVVSLAATSVLSHSGVLFPVQCEDQRAHFQCSQTLVVQNKLKAKAWGWTSGRGGGGWVGVEWGLVDGI